MKREHEPHRVRARIGLDYPGFALDLDLDLPGRGVTALFGPSGCGKTSCLRAIAGLERRARGHVSIHGECWQDDAQGMFLPPYRRAIGYVFQDANLFAHLSVAQNVAFGMKRVAPALRHVSLEQAVELLGIGHLMQRRCDALSGGERQRVAMARALATSPRILLLDEPLAALDGARKAEVLPYLERLHTELDMAVLYVSHAIDEVARLADHLVLLEDGHVRAFGAVNEMLTRLDLPLAHGDAAAAILEATVESHDASDHLSTLRFAGGVLLVPQAAGRIGQRLQLRVQARDVSLTLQPPGHSSILNILGATVTALDEDGPGQVMVGLDVGGCALLARITQRSSRALRLQQGQRVFAQIKGIAILG